MIILSTKSNEFPDPGSMHADGLFAIGGDLHPDRLLNAYRKGIFPWYNVDEPIQWWFPDPRCVLFPAKLKISKSMHQIIRKNEFQFSINKNFDAVIQNCMQTKRKNQAGSWIHTELISAYRELYERGFVESAEAWHNNELVGGLYGVKMGKLFFGESMFAKKNNASKFAFIQYTQTLLEQGIQLIDCQVETKHLISLGAETIPAKEFSMQLKKFI